ncbi:gp16_SPP1, putative phage head-tail adaptor [uncultured Caudovirales phage]|jgi:SPP1 family predicted phage head-tail adaptor|uniref:Gp16_SPP1, putative phage head-tail adaptor n=1 Tax=uncultured Caudovirales phage TaxID=2100421 RepID=A0A6J7WMH4_9CAUD|nr:gp16_SPP1, putative phage head-tail adaptor [uncultured Caudovirales phage]
MLISRFRQRIIFQAKTSEADGAGGQILTDYDYYTCWAEIDRQTENKNNITGKDSISDNIIFRIRYAPSITLSNDLTIYWSGNIYLINSIVNEDNEYKFYRIGCSTFKRVDTWDSITSYWENISKTWETV